MATKLLSLPDGPLFLILYHLGASNTNGSLQKPRHAFALAQTNTRLLKLFTEHITQIAPDFATRKLPTLSVKHLIAVSRLAGEALLELHLPESCAIRPCLAKDCPNLKVLSFVDGTFCRKNGLPDVLRLPLRSLSVHKPSPECLRMLDPPPPELTLHRLPVECYSAMATILQAPLMKLDLTIVCHALDILRNRSFIRLRRNLSEAIPKIKSVSIKMEPHGDWRPGTLIFAKEAERLIAAARQNSEDSICKSIKLDGNYVFDLLKKAHPNAKIELTRWEQTFIDEGDGMYAKKLPLENWHLEQDTSRLEEVRIEENCTSKWEKKLDGLRLKSAYIGSPHMVEYLSLSAETVEIPLLSVSGDRWKWLTDVRQLRLLGPGDSLSPKEQLRLFRLLTLMLNHFRGDVFWVCELDPSCFSGERVDARSCRVLKALISAIDEVEQRGGDVGTVKAMVDSVLTRWSMTRSELL